MITKDLQRTALIALNNAMLYNGYWNQSKLYNLSYCDLVGVTKSCNDTRVTGLELYDGFIEGTYQPSWEC